MKNLLSFFLFTTFLVFRIEAAAPGIHVLFAQAWLTNNPGATSREEYAFVAGTLFPDIRYLGTLDRKETHIENVKVKSIRDAENPFSKGVLLHCYVDEQRQILVKKRKIKHLLKEIPEEERTKFLKVLEDEICWEQVCKKTASAAMQNFYPEESIAGKDAVFQWHQEMSSYFKQRPSVLLKQLAEENRSFIQLSPESVKHWSELLPKYAEEPLLVAYTNEMLELVSKKF